MKNKVIQSFGSQKNVTFETEDDFKFSIKKHLNFIERKRNYLNNTPMPKKLVKSSSILPQGVKNSPERNPVLKAS